MLTPVAQIFVRFALRLAAFQYGDMGSETETLMGREEEWADRAQTTVPEGKRPGEQTQRPFHRALFQK